MTDTNPSYGTSRGRVRAIVLATLLVGTAGACAGPSRLSAEPGATFQAHVIHDGLLVDTMRGAQPGTLRPASLLRMPGDPVFVVADGSARGEAVWLDEPGAAVVRTTTSSSAPEVGRVDPRWTDDAIRLTIAPRGHRPLRSGPFVREFGAGPSVLTRDTTTSTDVEGTYLALLRYPDGSPAGWLRVEIDSNDVANELYWGSLPPSVDQGLAAATAAALGEEIDFIEQQTYGARRGTKRP